MFCHLAIEMDQRHRAGLRSLSDESSLFDQVSRDGAVNDSQNFAHQLRAASEQKSQLERKA